MVKKGARLAELFHIDECDVTDRHERMIELAEMIERIERSMSRTLQHYAHRAGLTFLESQVLAVAYEKAEDARPSLIAEKVRMPLSTMTGVAARLERRGLVERIRASDDGRAYVLQVTEDGEEKLRTLFGPLFEELGSVLDAAGSDALENVISAIGQVCAMAELLEARATVAYGTGS